MNKKINLNHLLEKAGNETYFEDGNATRIWQKAGIADRHGKSPLRWLVPVAAALSVLITVAAVPTARAAVLDFIGRSLNIMDYMSLDKGDRPKNTAVARLMQTSLPAAVTVNALPGSEWVKDIKVSVDEVLYDGKYVYVKYTVDSNGDDKLFEPKMATADSSRVEYKEFIASDLVLSDSTKLNVLSGFGPLSKEDGLWGDVVQFDAEGRDLTGQIKASMLIWFNNITETYDTALSNGEHDKNAISGYCKQAGTIEVQIYFDASAGMNCTKSIIIANPSHVLSGEVILTEYCKDNSSEAFTNRRVSLDGCTLTVTSVVKKPTDTQVELNFTPSESFAGFKSAPIYKFSFLDIVLKNGNKVVGMWNSAVPDGKGGMDITLSAPLLPDDVKSLTVCTSVVYSTSMNGTPMEIGKPYTLPLKENMVYSDDHAETAVIGGTFDIDLTQAK